MAVFAAGKACLDHRLREAKDVHRLILGMLEALQSRITECKHISCLGWSLTTERKKKKKMRTVF